MVGRGCGEGNFPLAALASVSVRYKVARWPALSRQQCARVAKTNALRAGLEGECRCDASDVV